MFSGLCACKMLANMAFDENLYVARETEPKGSVFALWE